jgi:hypothetical protein
MEFVFRRSDVNQARPIAFRVQPSRFSVSLFDRFYAARRDRWPSLYRDAEPAAAPGVAMELLPGDRISDQIAFTGVHEADLTQRVRSVARKAAK